MATAMHNVLIETLRKLPADMPIHVEVANSGVFTTITLEAACALLKNQTPKWELIVRDNEDHYHAWIACDEPCGSGSRGDDSSAVHRDF